MTSLIQARIPNTVSVDSIRNLQAQRQLYKSLNPSNIQPQFQTVSHPPSDAAILKPALFQGSR